MIRLSQRPIYLRDLLRELVTRERYEAALQRVRFRGGLVFAESAGPTAGFRFHLPLVLPLNIPNYTAFLFSGPLVWSWFQAILPSSANASIVLPNLKKTGVRLCSSLTMPHWPRNPSMPPSFLSPFPVRMALCVTTPAQQRQALIWQHYREKGKSTSIWIDWT